MSNYPLTKFTILFIAGIIIQPIIMIDYRNALLLFAISLLILIILWLLRKYFHPQIISALIVLPIIMLGITYYSAFTQKQSHYSFQLPKYKDAQLYGEIVKIELLREKRISFEVKSDSIIADKNKWIGKVRIICSVYDSKHRLSEMYPQLNIGNRISMICSVQKPRDQRNPYEFDYERYLNDRGVIALSSCYNVDNVRIISKEISLLKNLIFEIRKYLDKQLSRIHNSNTSSMLRGLILADRSGIDAQINQDFINAGVVHVLSVSGLHVGYIVIIFLFLFNRLNLYWRIFLTVSGLFIYMIITGSEAPVFRSTVMATVILVTPIIGRESNSYNTLSLAAFIILLLNPREIYNPSFQLSFSAILALIILFPIVKKWIDGKQFNSASIKYLLLFLGSTLAAQIGTLPFILVYFGRISITSLVANFFVIPISGFIVGLGIVSLFMVQISVWLAAVFASCNELLVYSMLWLVKQFGDPKYSIISIRQFTLYDSILFYTCLGVLITRMKRFSKTGAKVIITLLLIATFYVYSRLDNKQLLPPNKLSVLMIDVGQGDSFLVKFQNGKTALIDAGEANDRFDNGTRIILPLLGKLGIEKIDYGFISHVDTDHYMGFISLIKEGKIAEIYKPKLDTTKTKDCELEKYLRKKGLPIHYYSKSNLQVGNARLYILNENFGEKGKINTNDMSGILKLVFGRNTFLFVGDASVKIEKEYASRYGEFLRTQVLKAGHHGSKTSSSKLFVNIVNPEITLMSVGILNKFKHPTSEILARYDSINARIFRTDKMGAVLLQSDGNHIEQINWKNLD